MRTLALTAALATALTGTGCIVAADHPNGTLDLAWNFENSDGLVAGDWTAARSGCTTAAVSDVQVAVYDLHNRLVVNRMYPCREAGSGLPRAYVTGLPDGSYSFLATAYRSGSPVFEDSGTFRVAIDSTTPVDATLVVVTPAPLSVYFTQNGAYTCAGTPDIRYDLFDNLGNFIETNTVPCDPVSFGFTVTADQPVGYTYDFDIWAQTASGAWLTRRLGAQVRHTGFPTVVDLLP